MSVHRIASRYAKSLIELAIDQKKLEVVTEDVRLFQKLVKNRDLYLLLKSPIVHADKKKQILKLIFESKLDELFMAFLNILVSKGREAYLPEIADEYVLQYKQVKHISTVKLTTASPLTKELQKAIHEKLEASKATDEHVELVSAVDPALIGGFVVEFEDKIYDASVKHKLDRLRKEFRENFYISKIVSS
ncbi:MAG: ATP synthase F1 subunit delta [Lewinellaceae bacterium]|nr:ATP synthase F1 subunit delta [Lewinellaceae bacterium]MCB9287539.1 ATP synthase F1 subunit delta [Lewinellaceae bacterium]